MSTVLYSKVIHWKLQKILMSFWDLQLMLAQVKFSLRLKIQKPTSLHQHMDGNIISTIIITKEENVA